MQKLLRGDLVERDRPAGLDEPVRDASLSQHSAARGSALSAAPGRRPARREDEVLAVDQASRPRGPARRRDRAFLVGEASALRASAEPKTGPAISPCFAQNSSSVQSHCAWRISLEAATASGPLRGDRRGQLERGVDGAARLGEAVDDAQSSCARSASIGSPVSASSIASVVGHARGRRSSAPRGGHERALDLRDAELGARGGDDQVAGQRDLEAARDREALDRGDERLARRALDDAREAAARRAATRPRRRP